MTIDEAIAQNNKFGEFLDALSSFDPDFFDLMIESPALRNEFAKKSRNWALTRVSKSLDKNIAWPGCHLRIFRDDSFNWTDGAVQINPDVVRRISSQMLANRQYFSNIIEARYVINDSETHVAFILVNLAGNFIWDIYLINVYEDKIKLIGSGEGTEALV